jgi:hypothetical protein
MKKLFTILFLLISVSVFSQIRTNIFRVADDSTDISTSTVVPASLVLSAETNTLYVLPTGCSAATALYEISNKYAISALIGQPDSTMIVAGNIELPDTNKYIVVNTDGTVNFVAGTGGVDTLWYKTGGLIYTRPDITDAKVNGNFNVTGFSVFDTTIFANIVVKEIDDMSTIRMIVYNSADSGLYYLTHAEMDTLFGWTVDTANNFMFITDTSTLTGIGTRTPTEQLEVLNDIKADTAIFNYYKNTTGISTNSDSLFIYTYGNNIVTDTVIILNADTTLWSLVGTTITNKSNHFLEADTTVIFSGLQDDSGLTSSDYYLVGIDKNGAENLYYIDANKVTDSVTGYWTRDNDIGALYATTLSDYLGVGTNSPAHELDVDGSVGLSGNLYLPATTSTTGIIKLGGANFAHSIGTGNSFLGYNAGNLTMSGDYNTGIGERSLYGNTTGDENTTIGYYSLYANTTGGGNTVIGSNAIKNATHTASYNTAIGSSVLYNHATGNNNVFIGYKAGYENDFGANSVAIGYEAAAYDTNSTTSVYIGYQSGSGNSTKHKKSGNVFIGYQSGLTETGDNKLIIGNSSTSKLIDGDFSEKSIVINNTLEFDSSPNADQQFNGIISTHTTGEDVKQFDLCYMKSDGKLWQADASATSTAPCLWMAIEDANTTSGQFIERGYVRNDAWTLTVGGSSGIVYLSATTGEFTQTIPSGGDLIQPVGIAISADVMYFNPSIVYTISTP